MRRSGASALMIAFIGITGGRASAQTGAGCSPDDLCVRSTADSGPGTLRQAILDSNATVETRERIAFQLETTGPIEVLSALPTISGGVDIDATTQPGYMALPHIPAVELSGVLAGTAEAGLRVNVSPGTILASAVSIAGVHVHGFTGAGLLIMGGQAHRVIDSVIGARDPHSAGNLGYGIVLDSTAQARVAGNVVSGNGGGVLLRGLSGGFRNIIEANRIGTDPTGMQAVPNRGDGVRISNFGIDTAVKHNLISGNEGTGIVLHQDLVLNISGTAISENKIGTQVDGVSPLGNAGDGVSVEVIRGGGNQVGGPGAGNVIAYNGRDAVFIRAGVATITGNSIFENGRLGINLLGSPDDSGPTLNDPGDLDEGANGLQNFPEVVSATWSSTGGRVSGRLSTVPNRAYTVELFTTTCDPSGYGEGRHPTGVSTSVITDAEGEATFELIVPGALGAPHVTATARSPQGTSEFSLCRAVSLDSDDDGVSDEDDTCPFVANADQSDEDSDRTGDACDTDDDNDGVPDVDDRFPLNADEWADSDADGIGDNADQDDDGDGVADAVDNCPISSNADQQDGDNDGIGDVCDSVTNIVSVAIDIRPGTFPNSINLGSHGSVIVAILGSAAFDAATIAPETVTLANARIRLKGNGSPLSSLQDTNGDGVLDRLVHIETEAMELTSGDTEAILLASTTTGKLVRGVDSIRVVP